MHHFEIAEFRRSLLGRLLFVGHLLFTTWIVGQYWQHADLFMGRLEFVIAVDQFSFISLRSLAVPTNTQLGAELLVAAASIPYWGIGYASEQLAKYIRSSSRYKAFVAGQRQQVRSCAETVRLLFGC